MSRQFQGNHVRWVGAAGGTVTLFFSLLATCSLAQQRREREPDAVYAQRRAKLAAEMDGPIVLWGFTGREEYAQTYVFAQEENFYYLTGHNEEGAGLLILPEHKPASDAPTCSASGPREILFLPKKEPGREQWNGVRLSPTDPDVSLRTGFATVKEWSADFRGAVQLAAACYENIYTILPYHKENGGYPHEKAVTDWLHETAPQAKQKNILGQIYAQREIKSQGEIAFLQKAVDLSVEGHLAAMRMMRPELYEYQVAAKMVEVHAMGGAEAEGYAPIVGSGIHSTELHYDNLGRKMEAGDIVVLDVAAQYSGYSADITRTLPAGGTFSPRQREIYEIVLGAQNAALAKLKPGANFCRTGKESVYKISYDYINSHGKDRHGKSLGQYYIHGLGHPIGLNVHDASTSTDGCEPLRPGMVVTIEPGIYIPEEKLGVRIEDDALITEKGYKLLSEKLPREPGEIEKIMAAGVQERLAEGKKAD